MDVKVKVEDLNPGSRLNKLFNDFFRLNRMILAVPIENRDAGYYPYVAGQVNDFCHNNPCNYGMDLGKYFLSLMRENPKEYRTFQKDSPEFKFFQQFWGLHRKYINGDAANVRSEAYWDEVLYTLSKTNKEYRTSMRSNYIVNILLSFEDELERRDMEERRAVCS